MNIQNTINSIHKICTNSRYASKNKPIQDLLIKIETELRDYYHKIIKIKKPLKIEEPKEFIEAIDYLKTRLDTLENQLCKKMENLC